MNTILLSTLQLRLKYIIFFRKIKMTIYFRFFSIALDNRKYLQIYKKNLPISCVTPDSIQLRVWFETKIKLLCFVKTPIFLVSVDPRFSKRASFVCLFIEPCKPPRNNSFYNVYTFYSHSLLQAKKTLL